MFQTGRGPGLTPQDEQRLTLLMMQKEIRTITKDGFRLNGRLFWHEKLASRRHPVLVRYDDQLSPHEALVFTLDGKFLCTALDREHHRIAYGLHPAAGILGTAEQQSELRAALELKKGRERGSTATMRGMLQAVVLPETRARLEALEAATPTAPKAATIIPLKPTVTPEEEASLEAAKTQAREAMSAAPAYTPSDLKRWKDAPERYAYLFGVHFEQGLELAPADAAWMEAYEGTPEYERYLKGRYDAFRELYDRQRGNAARSA